MRHQEQFEAKLFGSSNMIWDAHAYKRSCIARTRGDERSQRFAAATLTILTRVERALSQIFKVTCRLTVSM